MRRTDSKSSHESGWQISRLQDASTRWGSAQQVRINGSTVAKGVLNNFVWDNSIFLACDRMICISLHANAGLLPVSESSPKIKNLMRILKVAVFPVFVNRNRQDNVELVVSHAHNF